MKLWLLRPAATNGHLSPWYNVYDMNYGFVVRAETKEGARTLAAIKAGDEGSKAWSDPALSSCVELTADGPEAIVMSDFHAG